MKNTCNKCGKNHDPCAGSHAQRRKFRGDELTTGTRHTVMTHGKCCCTSCRRVTLWHPRPAIDAAEEWIVKAIARVTWGDGCDGPEVEVDWKHGVILDLSGCWDSVVLEIIENMGADEDTEFTYGALSACCGAGAARGEATRTLAQTNLPAGGTPILFPIPPFAYGIRFATTDQALFYSSTTQMLQTGSGATAPAAIEGTDGSAFGTTYRPTYWPIIGGAESLVVLNADVAVDMLIEPQFLIGV